MTHTEIAQDILFSMKNYPVDCFSKLEPIHHVRHSAIRFNDNGQSGIVFVMPYAQDEKSDFAIEVHSDDLYEREFADGDIAEAIQFVFMHTQPHGK